MADEHTPATPPTPTSFTTPANVQTPANTNGIVPAENRPEATDMHKKFSAWPEFAMLGRWLVGCLMVLVGGWGLLLLAFFLTRSYSQPLIPFMIAAALDLVLFLFLEKKFWLSRFMGLRIEPGSHSWQSAIMLWLLGVPGLLFRHTNFHPETEAQAAPSTRPKYQPAQRGDSVREVVETIVFVVVLVLLIKSFAAEAFVIPTGSMAETLLGYQKEVTCPDCGIKFPINCSQEVDPSEGGRPTPVYACVCPNCQQRIHFPSAPEGHVNNFPESIRIDDPGWNSGDRVLVAKFVYDLLNKLPDRLDVVVFKYPGDSNFPSTGPHRNHVPMNYIKRLIGLPGETIAIQGGNLYYLPADRGLKYDDYDKALRDPELMATLWQKKPYMHIDDTEAQDRFNNREFFIIRKNPETILAMMRLVYDNDHPSKNDPQSARRWTSKSRNWSETVADHGFWHDGRDQDQPDWLTYQHISRDEPHKPGLIMDMMGYNTYQSFMHHDALLGNNWVGDLILECQADIDNPQGELTLELSRGMDRFAARWDLATGVCKLVRTTLIEQDNPKKEVEQVLDSKPTSLNKKGSYRLRFANVDEKLVVWVDNKLPFDSGVTYPAPKDLAPRKENDLDKPARIGVKGGALTVRKLKLFRDTYYTVGGGKEGTSPAQGDVPDLRPTDPTTYPYLSNPPLLTMYVQPEHFLCLGDNSPESSDGRSWGAVPRRLLLGRALLVYYPFGRAGRIR